MSEDLKFVFAGDLLLGGEWPVYAHANGHDLLAPFEKITRSIEDADIFFVNLEGPISETVLNHDCSRAARLVNHPDVVQLLRRAKTCVCVLANNHIMDSGSQGVAQTRRLLESNGILFVGAGTNLTEAQTPVIVESRGKQIGCLAFASDDQEVSAVMANDNNSGCAGLNDISGIESAIRQLKAKCDVVVVSLHWGKEFFEYPTVEQVAFVDRLARAGADYVMGHHPHVLQGVEQRGNCLVMYSLGHFFVPPFRRADGELIRPKAAAREFALVTCADGEGSKSFKSLGGKMGTDFNLEPYRESGQRQLEQKLQERAPGQIRNYDTFVANYDTRRRKQLRRERKLEAFSGLVREPLVEIRRRMAGRVSAPASVTA